MPTPTGLPKSGEVWQRMLPNDIVTKFVVISRGAGQYWGMRVYVPRQGKMLWVDCSYWFSKGYLKYVGQAGEETRKRLGI
jgi:hypothetical protein